MIKEMGGSDVLHLSHAARSPIMAPAPDQIMDVRITILSLPNLSDASTSLLDLYFRPLKLLFWLDFLEGPNT